MSLSIASFSIATFLFGHPYGWYSTGGWDPSMAPPSPPPYQLGADGSPLEDLRVALSDHRSWAKFPNDGFTYYP